MTKGPLQKINYIKRSEPFWILIRPNFTFAPRYRRPWVVSGFRNRCRTQTVPNERATTGGHTARAPDPQITKTPNWALGSCSHQIWGGYGWAGRPEGIWRDILESGRDFGRYGRGMKCAPEGSWGSCREQFRPKRETVSVCRRIGLDNRPCNQQNFSGKIVKTFCRIYFF